MVIPETNNNNRINSLRQICIPETKIEGFTTIIAVTVNLVFEESLVQAVSIGKFKN